MHQLHLNGRHKQVAATWDELTRQQLLTLMPALYRTFASKYEQAIELLAVLLGVSTLFVLRFTPVQILEVKWLTDFLLGEHVGLTKQLLPWVRGKWYQRKLWGPLDALGNVSFLEFVFADSYFIAYVGEQGDAYLDLLVSVLYRPQRWPYRPRAASYGGDRRQDFNENLLEARLPRVARLSPLEKLAILTWYRGCRHALELQYPLVFTPENEATASENPGGWAYVLREMSGGPFGNLAQTGRENMHTVLAKMEDDSRRAQELRRQQEAQTATT